MKIVTRRRSLSKRAGFVLGALLFAGCASAAKSEPTAVEPKGPSASPQAAMPAVSSGAELEQPGALYRREGESAGMQRSAMRGFKPIDWSTKPVEGASATSAVSPVPGTVPAVAATPVPAVFAERRASEALDRLAGLVTIRHDKRGAIITLPSDKLVESGQWMLTTSGQYTLRELAAGLRDQDGHTIFIQGYTDSMGTAAVNDALSLRRAEAVRDYLTTQGIAAESMRAEGLGAKRPLAGNGTPDGRAQNRRIEIVIAP